MNEQIPMLRRLALTLTFALGIVMTLGPRLSVPKPRIELEVASASTFDGSQASYVATYDLEDLFGEAGLAQMIEDWEVGCPKVAQRISAKEEIDAYMKQSVQGCSRKRAAAVVRGLLRMYPTRCLRENAVATLKAAAGGGPIRPTNNRGDRWPEYKYPQGFPVSSKRSRDARDGAMKEHRAMFPRPGTAGVIPFAGWPFAFITNPVVWDSTPRSHYVKTYARSAKKEAGGHLGPGHHPANPPRTASGAKSIGVDAWKDWNVHHIMERRFGGENTWGNLVPVWSSPRRNPAGNEHSKYTNWWHRYTPDEYAMRCIESAFGAAAKGNGPLELELFSLDSSGKRKQLNLRPLYEVLKVTGKH